MASFDGLRPLLVASHCALCSLANKLRSFVRLSMQSRLYLPGGLGHSKLNGAPRWKIVRHLRFNQKWIITILCHLRNPSETTTCRISTQSANARLSYWWFKQRQFYGTLGDNFAQPIFQSWERDLHTYIKFREQRGQPSALPTHLLDLRYVALLRNQGPDF